MQLFTMSEQRFLPGLHHFDRVVLHFDRVVCRSNR